MKVTIAIASCFLLVATAIQDVNAQGRRGGKGKGPQAGNPTVEAGAQKRNREQNNNAGQQQAGMRGMQGAPNAALMAQQLMANFDQDGNGELNQNELQRAMLGLMQQMQQAQRMQQMQQMQQMRMAAGQAMGMMGGRAQGGCQAGGAAGQNRLQSAGGNQFGGSAQRRGGGGKRGR